MGANELQKNYTLKDAITLGNIRQCYGKLPANFKTKRSNNYQTTLRNVSEEIISHLHSGGSAKSHIQPHVNFCGKYTNSIWQHVFLTIYIFGQECSEK
jgi:hypothetical protein